jgi:hypothetical protein
MSKLKISSLKLIQKLKEVSNMTISICSKCGVEYHVLHGCENIDYKALENKCAQQVIEPGTKFDAGKPMWDLLPYDALEEAVKILTSGATKYGSRNWEKGIPYGRIFGALMRHLYAWWMCKLLGKDGRDDESGRSHLSHAICELLFLTAYECRKMEKFDDRPMPSN